MLSFKQHVARVVGFRLFKEDDQNIFTAHFTGEHEGELRHHETGEPVFNFKKDEDADRDYNPHYKLSWHDYQHSLHPELKDTADQIDGTGDVEFLRHYGTHRYNYFARRGFHA